MLKLNLRVINFNIIKLGLSVFDYIFQYNLHSMSVVYQGNEIQSFIIVSLILFFNMHFPDCCVSFAVQCICYDADQLQRYRATAQCLLCSNIQKLVFLTKRFKCFQKV